MTSALKFLTEEQKKLFSQENLSDLEIVFAK